MKMVRLIFLGSCKTLVLLCSLIRKIAHLFNLDHFKANNQWKQETRKNGEILRSSKYIKFNSISLHDQSDFSVESQSMLLARITKGLLKAVKDNSHFLISPFSMKWAHISNFTH